jgi:hypothetical protein
VGVRYLAASEILQRYTRVTIVEAVVLLEVSRGPDRLAQQSAHAQL